MKAKIRRFYTSLPLQGKLFYLVITLGFLVSILNTFVNLALKLSLSVILTTSFTAVLCFIIMLIALKTRHYIKMATITFIILILFVYPSLWFFNDGSFGPTLIVYTFNTAIMPIILNKKKVLRFILLEFLSIIILLFIEIKFPQIIIHYPDVTTRIIDLLVGTYILIFFTFAMINGLMKEYNERINELHQVQRQLETQSITDELSGLYNRRFIMSEINRLLNQNQVFSLIMLDIDNFKQINDTYGHDIGDEVITGVGHLVQNQLNNKNIVGRIGGEEYLILLTDSEQNNSKNLADMLRKKISEISWTIKDLQVTVSGGFYTRLPEDDIIQLLKKVDLLLYKAKVNGKNCIMYL